MVLSLPEVIYAQTNDYKLGAGDVISIRIYGEPELSFNSILLTDSGAISFPFLGVVRTKGKTVQELVVFLTNELKNGYLTNPLITISINKYRDFFINGEVSAPSNYPFQPGLTLRKAISIAGGLTARASEEKMFVIRDDNPDKDQQKINMESRIYPGDMITIKQGLF